MKFHGMRGSLRRSACLCSLVVFGTAAIAAEPAASTANAKIASAAVPVAAVIKPVAFTVCAAEGDGAIEKCGVLGGTQTYTVPWNRTLLIEQITGTCAGALVNDLPALSQRISVVVVTGGTSVEHLLLGLRQTGGFEGYSDDTRLYADPGSTVSINMNSLDASPGGGRFCRLGFSGQFVK